MALNKIYNLSFLRIWFKSYRQSWWDLFSDRVIKNGLALIEQGFITSFELQANYLLVCGRKKREKEVFVVLDLKSDGTIACPQLDKGGNTTEDMAAVGLILLEKLFEDHINDLTLDLDEKPGNIGAQNTSSPKKVVLDFPAKLIFSKKGQGLFIEVFFMRHGNFEKLNNLNQVIKPSERECLLSLMLQLQKFGFKWNKDGLLSNCLESFESFVIESLPNLSKKYFVEYPDYIKQLAQSKGTVQLTLSAQKDGILGQQFSLRQQKLDLEIIEKSLRAKNHTYWSENHGLIHLQENTVSWLQRINDWKNRYHYGQLPAYLLLSIFNPNPITPSTRQWIQSFQSKKVSLRPWQIVLHPYQEQGVRWLKAISLANCHPLLADEMGLGKTRQLITWLLELTQNDERPSLVICPASAISAWQNECENCYPQMPIKVLSHDCTVKGKTLVLASYSQILANISHLKTLDFCCIILDEAQFIKNPKSKTAHACFKLKSQYRIASTGTPLENSLTDIWTIFRFLMPGFLGDFKEFHRFLQTQKNQEYLKQQIAPFVLRRTKNEVLNNLPQKNEMVVYCPMTPKQKTLYHQLLQGRFSVKDGQWMRLLALILRLRQACCDPGLLPDYGHLDISTSGKLNWLLDTLKNRQNDFSKIIIFSQFKSLLDRLHPHIKDLFEETYQLSGQTPTQQRRFMIKNFQTTSKRAAFLITLKAGGTAITLHAADTIFMLDPWWNPAAEQQAIARAHRLGQSHVLTVYRLLIEHSIESNIQALKQEKINLFKQLFDVSSTLPTFKRWETLYALLSNKYTLKKASSTKFSEEG